MVGTAIVIDESATNRIVLKVQLNATFPTILQASDWAEAQAQLDGRRPDVVMVSDTLSGTPAEDLIRDLRKRPDTGTAAIVVLTQRSDRTTRARMLAAGADDVFFRTQPEVLMHARLRSLIRTHGTEDEMRLRDLTGRSFGMAEPMSEFEQPGTVSLVTRRSPTALDWHHALSRLSRHRFMPLPINEALRWLKSGNAPDVVVIDLDGTERKAVLRLIADIRSQRSTRHAEVLLLTADHRNPVAADALDQGGSALLPFGFDPREVLGRTEILLRRKRSADRMRRRVQDGLRAAVTDSLTGLRNRRYAESYLDQLVEDAALGGRPFALALADIDHFKRVNDTHGHPAGDAALVVLADLLRDNLRTCDLVARFGGEEFLIVMPDTRLPEAQRVADRLREEISRAAVPVPGGSEVLHLTVSMGLSASLPPGPGAVERMIQQADRALYAAKGAGRNLVAVAAG
ncbi:hypothetical protein ATO6_21560 [Oceanicola sp. 22II-s10i]|uniref:diguanylate cyclase n=1 Tax=Oceanicola sp. 22II-s10i TaxID=1317116 RepID=UPI000B522D29|nr:diguanylate cyclase [Oceanicola sp. 22II-s10i]OWU82892.1 hypothetical protein ATO6_21560 [Oceanicola sp. 22II-s10i]